MNTQKIKWFHYGLAIPPIACYFLCWYLWQAILLLKAIGYKNFVQAVYSTTALATNKDATDLNESVETYHKNDGVEPLRKIKLFENVAILGILLTGIAWFAYPENERMVLVMPIQMILNAPEAMTQTLHNFALRR